MSEIANVSESNSGMGDSGRVNTNLPVQGKAKAPKAPKAPNPPNPIVAAAEKHNDAEASAQGLTHDEHVERPKEQGFEMTIFPLFKDILETTSKSRKEIIQVKAPAEETTSDNYTSKNNELHKTEEGREGPLLEVQANIEPERVLKLMEDKG